MWNRNCFEGDHCPVEAGTKKVFALWVEGSFFPSGLKANLKKSWACMLKACTGEFISLSIESGMKQPMLSRSFVNQTCIKELWTYDRSSLSRCQSKDILLRFQSNTPCPNANRRHHVPMPIEETLSQCQSKTPCPNAN